MLLEDALWSFGLLAALLGASLAFIRLRRGTSDFKQMRGAKERMPSSVRAFEKLTLYALTLGTGGLVFHAFKLFHQGQVSGATAVYAVVGALLVAIPVGALSANGISWVVPPLRRANLAAMLGSDVTFASANRGLILFGSISIPVGVIALAVAVFEPWVR